MSDSSSAIIKSVARVFEVIELFEEVREPLSAIRVSRALDYPQSSALALLKSMVSLGYLSFDRMERTYFPTLRMALLTDWLETSLHGDGDLQGLLDEIGRGTGETVSLSLQNDLFMQFIHIRLGSHPFMLSIRPGALAPLFRSAVGLTAMSERPDEEIQRYVQRVNRAAGKTDEKVELARVMEQIEEVRRAGRMIGYDFYMPSIGTVCWSLPTRTGKHSLVVSVAGPRERIKDEEKAIVRTGQAAIDAYKARQSAPPDRRRTARDQGGSGVAP